MKAWIVDRFLPGGEIRLADVPIPVPAADECLVCVHAAGLNFLDTLMIQGQYQVHPRLPFTPGVEIAGIVVEKGQDGPYDVGDQVCALIESGGFAQFAVVKKNGSQLLPAGMSIRDSIAFPVIYPTAYVALRERARLTAGETVLVLAAAGGVGSAAIQLAHHWGARVIAATGSTEKTSLCLELGADVAINYSNQPLVETVRRETNGRGVDVVFDPVGGQATIDGLRCLAWGGRLLVVGFAGGAIADVATNRVLLKNASVLGVYWGEHMRQDPSLVDRVFEELFQLYRGGAIRPLIRMCFALEDAEEAIRALATRRTVGKVVLLQGPSGVPVPAE